MHKPKLLKLRPNFLTIYYLLLLILSYFSGDNKLLSNIYNIFIKKGFKILDSRVLLIKNIAKRNKNNLEKFSKKINIKQIKSYYNLSKKIGVRDKGQAIIVSNNKLLLSENRNGTNNLIVRYKNLNRLKEFALLVKTAKPNQNLHLDLPTIGPNTIENIFKAGLSGLIVEEDKSLIASPTRTFQLIKKYNLFYYAI